MLWTVKLKKGSLAQDVHKSVVAENKLILLLDKNQSTLSLIISLSKTPSVKLYG